MQWAADRELQPLMGSPIGPRDLFGIDPLRLQAITPAMLTSNQFLEKLKRTRGNSQPQDLLAIDPLGPDLTEPPASATARHNIGRCIFESTRLDNARARLVKYDSLLCASNWAAGLLRSVTNKPVAMIHEGIDSSLFFPGPRSGMLDPNRFYVFSGGKIEFRKAQDLVILAFREFAARHDDAVLVAAWHSPWPHLSAGFQGKLQVPLKRDAGGKLEIERWVVENGIDPRQFIELTLTPNTLMPTVLREMDCAVQISRCEACTNLPAKEAMACGVPVILADNTGARDLIGNDNCIGVASTVPVNAQAGCGTDGWGESHVDDVLAALEMLYTDTQARKRVGNRGAEWILEQRRTWRDHAAALKAHLLELF
jgi:glycosyltransferase involved in cell wall biosynthesis